MPHYDVFPRSEDEEYFPDNKRDYLAFAVLIAFAALALPTAFYALKENATRNGPVAPSKIEKAVVTTEPAQVVGEGR